jgi:hypothetical protein
MQRHSEFPLFIQTALALFGFLLLISLFSWVTTPKISARSSTAHFPQFVAQ